MPRSDYTLKTLRKGLEVLETLADDRDALTLTALAERLQESPPVVFRILRTLEGGGYVEQDAGSKRWQPGFRAWEIGCRVVNRTGLVEAARPLLKALTEFTEETSYLAVVRGTDTVYLDTVVGLEPLRVYAEPGFRVPLYLTASGKAILAFQSGHLLDRVLDAGMKKQTPLTITKQGALRARLDEIRRTGVSINRGERRTDVSARSEEHTSELQSLAYLVCRLLLEKKKDRNHSLRWTAEYIIGCVATREEERSGPCDGVSLLKWRREMAAVASSANAYGQPE